MLSCHSLKWVPNIWELRQVSAHICLSLAFLNKLSWFLVILQINFNNSFFEHFQILWTNCHFSQDLFPKETFRKKDSLCIGGQFDNAWFSISWCVGQVCRFSARLLFITTLGEIYLYSGRTHTAKWFRENAVFWVIDSKAISFVGNELVRNCNQF